MPECVEVQIKAADSVIQGDLVIPEQACAVILFAHGSGSSRLSSRNRAVAAVLNQHRLATLLIDLLTEREEQDDLEAGSLRFNIPFLAYRLLEATDWLSQNPLTRDLPFGYFGASTGAAAALLAAAECSDLIRAVVSRGGRPDLAENALPRVQAPTLLIVGGQDTEVLELNKSALAQLGCSKKSLEVVPGAAHLFEEPGALEKAALLAARWFSTYCSIPSPRG